MGVDKWIDLELHPEKIDDSALDERLAEFPAMKLGLREIMVKYPTNNIVRGISLKRPGAHIPSARFGGDSKEVQAIYNVSVAADRARYAEQAAKADSTAKAEGKPAMDDKASKKKEAAENLPAPEPVDTAALLALAPGDRYQKLLSLQPESVRPFFRALRGKQHAQLIDGFNPEQREVTRALEFAPARVVDDELLQSRMIRAIYSKRELNEVLVNFWLNYFSIYLRKNQDEPYYLTSFDRDVIRPHAMGKFEDLLSAVAHSPAMLVYLDNQLSVGPDSQAAGGRQVQDPKKKKANGAGINENYARELMELHTLGVGGGYSQQDVIQVARVLTGWGVNSRKSDSDPVQDTFEFNANRHEPGAKLVLGKTIAQSGQMEGEQVLHMLCESPATARFVSTRLAVAFVSDNPPQSLIDRMAKTFQKKHGDIREVLATMLHSKEFWSQDAYRAKLKTPLEFVTSTVRATNAQVDNAGALVASLDRLGMPLYGVIQPNGYNLTARPWLGSEALLERMNFALALTSNRINGIHVTISGAPQQPLNADGSHPLMTRNAEVNAATPDFNLAEASLEDSLMDGDVTEHTHDAVLEQMSMAADAQMAAQKPKPASDSTSADDKLNALMMDKKAEDENKPAKAEPIVGTMAMDDGNKMMAAPKKPAAIPQVQKADPIPLAAALLLGSPDFQRR